jgi:tetrapyrrole methylase family protein/MazG family protein
VNQVCQRHLNMLPCREYQYCDTTMSMANENNQQASLKKKFSKLYSIIKQLRGPEGCPWDKKQTASTLRKSLVEEAYECINAIDEEDDENLKEELGDLFLVILMIIRIKEQEERFTIQEVLDGISEKLIRRHPHVFGNDKVKSVDDVIIKWEHIKTNVEGKKREKYLLDSIPKAFPPLGKAIAIQKKVSRIGFDWKNVEPVWHKLEEEIDELKTAYEKQHMLHMEEELGDIIFTIINIARLMNIDPSIALNRTNNKFIERFTQVEKKLQQEGIDIHKAGLELMDALWNEIKKRK